MRGRSRIKADLWEAIKLRFDAEGIGIPYSFQNVIPYRAQPAAAADPAEPGAIEAGEAI